MVEIIITTALLLSVRYLALLFKGKLEQDNDWLGVAGAILLGCFIGKLIFLFT